MNKKTQSWNRKWLTISIMATLFMVMVSMLIWATSEAWQTYIVRMDLNSGGHTGNVEEVTAWSAHNIFGITVDPNNRASAKGIDSQWTWGNISAAYKALFFGGIALGLVVIVFVASWLRGSNWINKKNPFMHGKEYIRTQNQNIVFRTLIVMAAILMLWSFSLEVTFDIRGNDADDFFKKLFTSYIFDMGNWYYQCFLSSLFIGIALMMRKYNLMPVLLPLAFLGGARTFIDPQGDWGENAVMTSTYFHRFMMIHIIIWLVPIFVIVANRQKYDLLTIKRTVYYTFFMVFVGYLMILTTVAAKRVSDSHHAIDMDFAELTGAGALLGKDADWINAHAHIYFWFIVVPFGLAVIAGFALITNASYYITTYKKNAWTMFKQSVKTHEKEVLLDSFTMTRKTLNVILCEEKKSFRKKFKYIQFGKATPKGVARQNSAI